MARRISIDVSPINLDLALSLPKHPAAIVLMSVCMIVLFLCCEGQLWLVPASCGSAIRLPGCICV
jgi:hypothetical protein